MKIEKSVSLAALVLLATAGLWTCGCIKKAAEKKRTLAYSPQTERTFETPYEKYESEREKK